MTGQLSPHMYTIHFVSKSAANLTTDSSLLRLLNVSRKAKEGGAICVREGGDEGDVVSTMTGHWKGPKWESLHTTFHWRHHLMRWRETGLCVYRRKRTTFQSSVYISACTRDICIHV